MKTAVNNRFQKIILGELICLFAFSACDNYHAAPSFNPDADVSVVAGGTIIGTVYDAESGQPVSGVSLSTTPATVKAVSSADGTFTLSKVSSGTYDLVAVKRNYSTSTTEEVTVTEEVGAGVTIQLYTEDGIVTGTVANTKDSPLGAVALTMVDESTGKTTATTTTNESGDFFFEEIPVGKYAVRATPADSSYCTNEKLHLAVTGTSVVNLVLSGKYPEGADYVGSEKCRTCHADEAAAHEATSHANVLKEPDAMASGSKSVFENGETISIDVDPSGAETAVEITLSIGSGGRYEMTLAENGPYAVKKIYGGNLWKENYLTEIGGRDFVLPIAWAMESGSFIFDPETGKDWFGPDGSFSPPASDESYENRCVGCHVTGFEVRASGGLVTTVSTADSSKKYLEANIGCERCHGPGSKHAEIAASADPVDSLEIVHPRYLSLKQNSQVCGQCHSKGEASRFTSAEVSYPVDAAGKPYKPGNNLDDTFSSSNDQWFGTGYSQSFHQEYTDFLQSKHYRSNIYNPRCSDCHDAHGGSSGDNPHLLKYSVNDNTLCLNCHTALNFPNEYSIRLHTQHPYDPDGTGASRCVGCHLTKTGTVAEFTDAGGHTFMPVKPLVTLEMLKALEKSGKTDIQEEDLIPNPCMQCHNRVLAEAEAGGKSVNALGGDPTNEAYLTLLTEAYQYKFEEAKGKKTYASFSHTVIGGWMDKNSSDHHGKYYLDNPETCTNACHGADLKGGELSDGSDVPACFNCHYPYPHEKRMELDEGLEVDGQLEWGWIRRHKYYYTDTVCASCHGEDYRGGISGVSCYRCHDSPGVDFTDFTDGCGEAYCHAAPPAVGRHSVHFGGVYDQDVAAPHYGDTTNYSTADSYRFGCGTCHPMSGNKHRNGTIDIELYNENADPDTMKGKMPPNARFDPETRTCANVYCHSYTEYTGPGGGKLTVPYPVQPDEVQTLGGIEDQIAELNGTNTKKISSYFVWNNFKAPDDDKEAYYWSLPLLFTLDALCTAGSTDPLCQGGVDSNGVGVYSYDTGRFGYRIDYPGYDVQQVRRYQTTPNWDGNESLQCNGCHGFPPRAYLTEDEWSEDDPDWSEGAPDIRKEAAIDKHSFVIPRLDENGATIEVGHMANMRPFSNAPLRCQTCHYQTVSKINLNDWESGTGWSREDGIVTIDNLSINDRTYHVNGQIDVVFDTSGAVTSYRFNNESTGYMLKKHPLHGSNSGDLQAVSLLDSNKFYGIKGKNSPGAAWNPDTKTCSNVSCHLEQTTVTWTKPYRPYSRAECYQCHQYYSDPTKGEDETMCWPHADRNGCEYKESPKVIPDETIL